MFHLPVQKLLTLIFVCVLFLCSHSYADIINDSEFVNQGADGTLTTNVDTYLTQANIDGNSAVGGTGTLGMHWVRGRVNSGQNDRKGAAFLHFDVTTLTATDVADPTFSAEFCIDYVGRLNNTQAGDLFLGTSTTAWDSTSGTNFPLHSYAYDPSTGTVNATNQQVLISDARSVAPTGQTVSVDVTTVVQDWYNGITPNNGFTIFFTNSNQGVGLENAILKTAVAVPEPNCMFLGLLGLGGAFLRRARPRTV